MDIRPQQLSALASVQVPLNHGNARKGQCREECHEACKAKGIKMLFLVVMIFAAGFLGRADLNRTRAESRLAGVMDVVVFKTPRWSPTGFLNVQIALAPGAHNA